MKIAKLIVITATLVGAFQANALCPQLAAATTVKQTKEAIAAKYSREISGQGTPASTPPPPARPAATTGV